MWQSALLEEWYHVKSSALLVLWQIGHLVVVIPRSASARGSPCCWAMHGFRPSYRAFSVHGSVVHALGQLRREVSSFPLDESSYLTDCLALSLQWAPSGRQWNETETHTLLCLLSKINPHAPSPDFLNCSFAVLLFTSPWAISWTVHYCLGVLTSGHHSFCTKLKTQCTA